MCHVQNGNWYYRTASKRQRNCLARFSLTIVAQERAECSFQWKQEGVKAAFEYAAKEQTTRLLAAKLRAERLARKAK